MARIAGVNIPTNKRVVIALQYIHGAEHSLAQCSGVRGIPPALYRNGHLLGKAWVVVSSRPWAYVENISVLEGRAVLSGLNHALSFGDVAGKTHVGLIDNMGVTLALEKGRSSKAGVRTVCRRVAAALLSCDAFAAWRWIPSESNRADPASRRFEHLCFWA